MQLPWYGVKPGPEKALTIKKMNPPKDKKKLNTQFFMGMGTYMSSFIHKVAVHTAPPRNPQAIP